MPSNATRFRFKNISNIKRVRLGFKGKDVVEVTDYTKRNGRWVKNHTRNPPRKSMANKEFMNADFDGDGISNKKDCKPFDKNKQDDYSGENPVTGDTTPEEAEDLLFKALRKK